MTFFRRTLVVSDHLPDIVILEAEFSVGIAQSFTNFCWVSGKQSAVAFWIFDRELHECMLKCFLTSALLFEDCIDDGPIRVRQQRWIFGHVRCPFSFLGCVGSIIV